MPAQLTIEEKIARRKKPFDVAAKYRRWWLDKRVRVAGDQGGQFRLVVAVEWCGDPVGVVGNVLLTYEDGTRSMVPTIYPAPKQTDLKVHDEDFTPLPGRKRGRRPRAASMHFTC